MKQDIRTILDDRRRHRILVVGDLMLDRYVWGEVDRISPEAPIPVLRISRQEDRPGGAASVACNLSRLGCHVSLTGVVGADPEGAGLRDILGQSSVADHGVLVDGARPTVLKCRQIARGQQMLRVDREVVRPLPAALEAGVCDAVRAAVPEVDCIVLSDYAKGVLTPRVLDEVREIARTWEVPVIVDPKRQDFSAYRDLDLITPNRAEAARATGLAIDDVAQARHAATTLIERFGFGAVALTLDRDGIVLAHRAFATPVHLPTHPREVIDVTGAGDMVISIFALAVAGGHDLAAAAALANVAGGLVVSRLGVVSLTNFELRAAVSHEAGQHLGKLLDADEFRALCALCGERSQTIVLVTGEFDGLRAADIDLLRQASEAGEVVVAGLLPRVGHLAAQERTRILAALEDIDYVIELDYAQAAQLHAAAAPGLVVMSRDSLAR